MMKLLLLTIACFQIINAAPAKKDNNRKTSFPYISGDSFRALAHHVFDETDSSLNPHEVRHKDIIFLKADYKERFFRDIHPQIKNKYILITHNADDASPGTYESYLNDDKILMWFGQNPSLQGHKKFMAIPIGVANSQWPHGKVSHFTSVLKRQDSTKKYLLAYNVVVATNVGIRKPVYDIFIGKPFCTNLYNPVHVEYLKSMGQAKFTLSPAGNGLDCHRTWEALLVGSIPVMKTSFLDELLIDLPVLIINEWTEVTEEFLNKKYEEMHSKFQTYNLGKIYMPYWIRLIEYYRDIL